MANRDENGDMFTVMAFLFGATLGCVSALMLAPSSGTRLRKRLRRRGRGAAAELRDRGGATVNRIGEAVEGVSSRAHSIARR